ncbi:N/A [soil metagenome]
MRLLIVEDDPDGREMLAEIFRMHDWAVTATATLGEGLSEIRSHRFDVIISDEDLDGESGSSMLRQAEAEGLLGGVGAVMYTAESGSLEVPSGVRVLRKPLAMRALLREVRAVTPEGAEAGSPTSA